MKQQIVVIHGGRTFRTHQEYIDSLKHREVDAGKFKYVGDWRDNLGADLGDGFEVFNPKMPNAQNAVYQEWQIWFERMLPLLQDNIILIGHSMGGIFLAKYLSENTLAKKIKAVILVAPPFDDENLGETLGSFTLPSSLELFSKQVPKTWLVFSQDDPIVPFLQLEKYKKACPNAKTLVFQDRQHFNFETFLEIEELLKKI